MVYTVGNVPSLDRPVMVSALAGWVDAAAAGTSAAAKLIIESEVVATFDSDLLFDYRSQRPILDIVDGVMTQTVWPEVVVRHSRVDDRDLLVLTGLEPDLAWKRFASGVAELAERFGVAQFVTLGSVPAAVPHTLPPPVMTTASNIDLLKGEVRPPEGLLRVPAAAVSMVDQQVAATGVPTVGFFVQVPHYVTAPYTSAVLALLSRLEQHLEFDLSLGSLAEEAIEHKSQLDEIVARQPEAQEHVRQLEAMNEEQRVVSGEELASEIERYLRDASPGD
jgi:hypothetical protein